MALYSIKSHSGDELIRSEMFDQKSSKQSYYCLLDSEKGEGGSGELLFLWWVHLPQSEQIKLNKIEFSCFPCKCTAVIRKYQDSEMSEAVIYFYSKTLDGGQALHGN